MKKSYKRLPICILGDSLYAAESIFKICEDFDWRYIIRLKEKRIPTISNEFELLKDMEEDNQKEVKKEFCWVSDIKITSGKLAEEIAKVGRKRWKIENEGFNV